MTLIHLYHDKLKVFKQNQSKQPQTACMRPLWQQQETITPRLSPASRRFTSCSPSLQAQTACKEAQQDSRGPDLPQAELWIHMFRGLLSQADGPLN